MSEERRSIPGLAYLTTAYPSVSHTFIRREILELERLGYAVVRVAIRPGEAVVDADDKGEQAKTLHLLGQSKAWILWHTLRGIWLANFRLAKTFAAAWQLNRASERGSFRHLAYCIEALALRSYFDRRATYHVHVHFGTNSAAVAMLTKLLGGPSYSMTVHGPDEFDAAIGLSLARKMREATFTIAVTHYCSSQLRRWVPYEEWSKIHIVHCTVGGEWAEAARPIDDKADTIVCIGRLSAQKGQLLLIDAMAGAVAKGFRGRLTLIGDGEMRRAIEDRISAHGLGERVEITGWCTGIEVRERLLNGRALVLASFAEGLPVVIMESMALQRPVVSTIIAGIPELVRDGEHGWLVVTGDADALVEALLKLDNASLQDLHAMGRACNVRVRERHSTQIEVAKLSALFEQCSNLARNPT